MNSFQDVNNVKIMFNMSPDSPGGVPCVSRVQAWARRGKGGDPSCGSSSTWFRGIFDPMAWSKKEHGRGGSEEITFPLILEYIRASP